MWQTEREREREREREAGGRKRKRRVSTIANVTNNAATRHLRRRKTHPKERARLWLFSFVPPDDKISTPSPHAPLHLGAYLSSIIGFTLRHPSLLRTSPPPLHCRPPARARCLVIYRNTQSHLTTLLRVFRTEAIIILANVGRAENQPGGREEKEGTRGGMHGG